MAARPRLLPLGVLTLFLLLLISAVVNTWSGEQLLPISQLRDQAYANEPKEFNFKPLLDRKDGSLQTTFSLFLLEAYPLLFSLPTVIVVLLFLLFGRLCFRPRPLSARTAAFVFSALAFTLLYLAATQVAHVVTNARYLIILYPLFAILAGVIVSELMTDIPPTRTLPPALSARFAPPLWHSPPLVNQTLSL
jgi:hypothetical protein